LAVTFVLLIPAASTEWTRDGRYVGRRDLALSAEGRAEAERLAEGSRDVDVAEVLTSPLQRALETAAPLATLHGIDVARDPRLTGVALGGWEGRRRDELVATDAHRLWLEDPIAHPAPGVEDLEAVRERVAAAVEEAIADNDVGAVIAVVSHRMALATFLLHATGQPLSGVHRTALRPGLATVLSVSLGPTGVRAELVALNHEGPLSALGLP
jgi:broad specificity phosphatase PhoE